MAKRRKTKTRGPLRSVCYLATGTAGAAAASAGILMALPPNAPTALTAPSTVGPVEQTSFDIPLFRATDPWWQPPVAPAVVASPPLRLRKPDRGARRYHASAATTG